MEMYNRFKLLNFKCFEKAELVLKRFNILIGENGSGKSSVIHGLLALRQSLNDTILNLNQNYIRLGDYADIVYKHQTERNVGFELEVCKPLREFKRQNIADTVTIVYSVSFRGLNICRHESKMKLGKYEILTSYNIDAGMGRVDPSEISPVEGVTIKIENRHTIGLPFYIEAKCELPELRAEIRGLYDIIRNELTNLRYVPPLRGFGEPHYPLGDREYVEFLNYPNLRDVAMEIMTSLTYDEEFERRLSTALSNIVDTKIKHKIIPSKVVTVVSDMARGILNEGFGLNQLLWLFSQVIKAPEGSLILIEEPEIHLHPRAQSKLVDTLVEIIKKENKQLLITTHSEHILLKFLNIIANRNLHPDEVSVYYFERGKEPEKLNIDEKGCLDKGLKGFFEYEVDELSDYLRVLSGKSN